MHMALLLVPWGPDGEPVGRVAAARPAPLRTAHAVEVTSVIASPRGRFATALPSAPAPQAAPPSLPAPEGPVATPTSHGPELPPSIPSATSAMEFVPRSLLSLAPVPAHPIVVPFPDSSSDTGRFVTVLRLFIDETGHVLRVVVDGPPIPAALEAAARDTFMHATFSPGQVDGVDVRSVIRVEVTFDNTPLDPPR